MGKIRNLLRSVMEIMRGHPVLCGLILAASILEGFMLYEGFQGYEDVVGPVWLKWFYVGLTAVLSCLVVTLWREGVVEPDCGRRPWVDLQEL